MEELDTTNPEAEAPEVETEVQESEPQLDADGNPIEEPTDDLEELDVDDVKVKLPKAVAEKLRAERMMQADYTRKTQELAEQRKAFEAERQATTQADEQELTARANIAMIDRQLAQFQQVNWNAWNDSDPFEAQKAFQQYQLLKDAKQNAHTFLSQKQTERTERQQQETAKRLQEGAAELARDIAGWSPDLSAKLQEFGSKAFGLSRDDFDNITDPRAVKLLYWAQKGMDAAEAAKKAKSVQKQQEVTPAASVSRTTAPPKGLDDRLSTDEWLARRNAQLAKRGGK